MSKFIFAGTEFEIDFDKIYEKLSISERQSFNACNFKARYKESKDWVKSAKYIVGPPFDKSMEEESALMYIMLFGDERDISRDKIQMNNFAFRANLILNQFTDKQREEFFSLIQFADYSYIIKRKLRNKEVTDFSYPVDKCVSFFFDEPQFENVFRISLYTNGHSFKAQQWTLGNNDVLTKGPKENVKEDVFWGIMMRAIDLMFQEDGKDYGEVAEKCIAKVKSYFLGSTEETVSSYELKNVVYEYSLEKGFINKPQYDYDPSNYILIHNFETKNYNREFLMSRDGKSFLIGSQVNQGIDLDMEKNMVYESYSDSDFKKELMESIINYGHREKLLSSVGSISKMKPTKSFDNLQDFVFGNTFDFNEFCNQVFYESCIAGIAALNPYNYEKQLSIIPNVDDKLFAFDVFSNIYMVCNRDVTGIISKTEFVSKDTFTKQLREIINNEYPGRFDLSKITPENASTFSGIAGNINMKKFFEFATRAVA